MRRYGSYGRYRHYGRYRRYGHYGHNGHYGHYGHNRHYGHYGHYGCNGCYRHYGMLWTLPTLQELRTLRTLRTLQELRTLRILWEVLSDIWPIIEVMLLWKHNGPGMLLFWKKSKKQYPTKLFHYMKSVYGQSKKCQKKCVWGAFAKNCKGLPGNFSIPLPENFKCNNPECPPYFVKEIDISFSIIELNEFSRAKGLIYTETITYLLYILKRPQMLKLNS